MVVMIPLGVQGVEAALCEMILWPQLPDLPRWQVSGRGDLAELGRRVYDTTWRWQKDARVPSRDDVDLILEILNGRFVPPRDPVAVAEDREERAQRLTAEQANLLKVTRLLPRVEIRGRGG